jgi:preprotein translocase subunit SecB
VNRALTEVRVEASHEFLNRNEADGTSYEAASLKTEQAVKWVEEKQVWHGEVTLECWPGPEVIVPYRFRLQAIGAFKVREGVVPPEELEKFVSCNVPAVLYASCRDALRFLTMQGPYQAVELPLVFFSVSKIEAPAEVEESSKS